MGLISIALGALGTAADIAALPPVLNALIHRDKNCDVRELFKRCFVHAVKQRATHLAHFSQRPLPESVYAESKALDDAVKLLDTHAAVDNVCQDTPALRSHPLTYLRPVLVIEDNSIPTADFD